MKPISGSIVPLIQSHTETYNIDLCELLPVSYCKIKSKTIFQMQYNESYGIPYWINSVRDAMPTNVKQKEIGSVKQGQADLAYKEQRLTIIDQPTLI